MALAKRGISNLFLSAYISSRKSLPAEVTQPLCHGSFLLWCSEGSVKKMLVLPLDGSRTGVVH